MACYVEGGLCMRRKVDALGGMTMCLARCGRSVLGLLAWLGRVVCAF